MSIAEDSRYGKNTESQLSFGTPINSSPFSEAPARQNIVSDSNFNNISPDHAPTSNKEIKSRGMEQVKSEKNKVKFFAINMCYPQKILKRIKKNLSHSWILNATPLQLKLIV